ncbi:MAG: hypothetical protein GY861_05335, partial [bacterium]|nr:hypothetical protein [bacterium]
EIIQAMRNFINQKELKIGFDQPRLRKIVNYIRTNALLPLIATSNGYYVSEDTDEIKKQVESLEQRSRQIQRSADGLKKYLS